MATLNISKKIVYDALVSSNITNTSAYQVLYSNPSYSRVMNVMQFTYSYVSGPNLNVQLELYDLDTGQTLRSFGGLVGVINTPLVNLTLGGVGTDEAFRGHFLIYPRSGIRYKNSSTNAAIHNYSLLLLGEENTQ